MAQLALGVAGAVVGTFFGMPQVGFLIGSTIGSLLFPPKGADTQGPRLNDLSTQTCSQGAFLGIAYGTILRAGNIFFTTEKREVKKKQKVGGSKGIGGGTSTTYEYYQSFAVCLNDGEIEGLLAIKANKKNIVDLSVNTSSGSILGSSEYSGKFRIYKGTKDQPIDPLIESIKGVGKTPNYKNTAYILFEDFNVTNGLPSLEFLVVGKNGGVIKNTIAMREYDTKGWSRNDDGTARVELAEIFSAFSNRTTYFYTNIKESNEFIQFTLGSYIYDVNSNITSYILPDLYDYKNYQLNKTTLPNSYNFDLYKKYRDKKFLVNNIKNRFVEVVDKTTEDYKNNPPFLNLKTYNQYIYTAEVDLCVPVGRISGENYIYLRAENINKSLGMSESFDDAVLFLANMTVSRNMNGAILPEFKNISQYFSRDEYYVSCTVDSSKNRALLITADNKEAPYSKFKYYIFNLNNNGIFISNSGDFNSVIDINTLNSKKMHVHDTANYKSNTNTMFKYMINNDKIVEYASDSSGGSMISLNQNFYNMIVSENRIELLDRRPYFLSNYVKPESSYFANNILISNFEDRSWVYSVGEYIETKNVDIKYFISDQISRVNGDLSRVDLSELTNDEIIGYFVNNRSSVRANIETIAPVYLFDTLESQGKIKFKKRGSEIVASIPNEDLGITNDNITDREDDIEMDFLEEKSLPYKTEVQYLDKDSGYNVNVQYAERLHVNTTEINTLQIPIVLDADFAKRTALTSLYASWSSRTKLSFKTTLKYIDLEPTDLIEVENHRGFKKIVRIAKKTIGENGVIEWECFEDDKENYKQSEEGVKAPEHDFSVKHTAITKVIALNLPIINQEYQKDLIYSMLVTSYDEDAEWNGAQVLKTEDNGSTFTYMPQVFDKNQDSVIGTATCSNSVVVNSYNLDIYNKFTVVVNDNDILESCTYDDLIKYQINTAFIGNEIIQFKDAKRINQNTWEISGLLRGLYGTERLINTHIANEVFAILDIEKMQSQSFGLEKSGSTISLLGLTFGLNELSQSIQTDFTPDLTQLKPLSPSDFVGITQQNGNINMKWIRRARLNAKLVSNIGVPLDEQYENYNIDIYNSNNVLIKTYEVNNQTTFNYTKSMQIADGVDNINNFRVEISQISMNVGKGFTSIIEIV